MTRQVKDNSPRRFWLKDMAYDACPFCALQRHPHHIPLCRLNPERETNARALGMYWAKRTTTTEQK